jgi:hypothetical protein
MKDIVFFNNLKGKLEYKKREALPRDRNKIPVKIS